MAFIDGEEKPLASLSTEAQVYKQNCDKLGNIHTEPIKGIYEMFRNAYATPLLDPTRYVLFGVDLAKDDSLTDLKINIKRRNIKFNFNN